MIKKIITKILGYVLALGGFLAMFTEGDPRWQLLWTLGAGLCCLLGCTLLTKAGVIPEED